MGLFAQGSKPGDANDQAYNNAGKFGNDALAGSAGGYYPAPNANIGQSANGANGLAGAYQQQAAGYDGKQFNMGNAGQSLGMYQDSRNQQQATMNDLYNRAKGLGRPSIAQQQMSQGLGQAQSGQNAIAASAQGNPAQIAAAQRAAKYNSANMGIQEAGQSQALGAQEQAQARQQYMAQANAMRGQDQNAWGQLSGAEVANANMNQGMQLGSQGMSNQLLGAQLGADSAGDTTVMNANYAAANAQLGQDQNMRNQITGAGLGAATGMFTGA